MKIIFLAANPQSTSRLNLGKEVQEIDEGLRRAKLSDRFQLAQRWEVRPRDLRRALLEENPNLVHFSGHGKGQEGLVLVDNAGNPKPAPGQALAGLFIQFPQIKCVLLNACYAEVQAQAIIRHIDYVIGMKNTLSDDAAIAFSIGFYDGLGSGRTIEDAFEFGKNSISLELPSFFDTTRKMVPVDLVQADSTKISPEHLKPILLKKAENAAQQFKNKPISNVNSVKSNNFLQQREQQNSKQKEGNSQPEPNLPSVKIEKFSFDVLTVDEKGKENRRTTKEAELVTEDLGEGVTLEMVKIPGGTFLMGTEDEEIKKLNQIGEPKGLKGWLWNLVFSCFNQEKPLHKVDVPSFWMGRYPITQAQWRIVAGWESIERELNPDPSSFKDNYKGRERWTRPVENISWEEAVEFCARLSQKTNGKYRLPTEAEWEYACRAGTTTPFHFGETISTQLANYRGTDWEYEGKIHPGNYGKGLKGIFREQTTPVGYFQIANAFGLYDMHGNVWEWCADHPHDSYDGAPRDGSAWITGGNPEYRILRGGSWIDTPAYCRSAIRSLLTPAIRRDYVIGFRVVCAVLPGLF